MNSRKFESILLKNTLAIAVPTIAVFCVLTFMLLNFPVFDRIENTRFSATESIISQIEKLYTVGSTNVTGDIHNLYYAGFDQTRNGKVYACYYYTIDDDGILLYLINAKGEPEEFLQEYTVKGKILNDQVHSRYIISSIVEELGLDMAEFSGYLSPFVISEADYPYSLVVVVYSIFFIPVVLSVLIMIYTLVVWCNPKLHSQTKQLLLYGDVGDVIADINQQLTDELVFHQGNVYITNDYVIVSYFSRTDVIHLDYVKYLSINELEDAKGNQPVYRITMSDADQLFYEVDFIKEELAYEVMEYIVAANPQVRR